MSDSYEKDPSIAEVGPLARQGTPTTSDESKLVNASGDLPDYDDIELGDTEEPDGGTKEASGEVEKEASPPGIAMPDPVSILDDYKPLREVPDLGDRANVYDDRPTEVTTHDADDISPNTEELVRNQIEGEGEVQVDESQGDVVRERAEKDENARKNFLDEPTEVSIDRGKYDDAYHRWSNHDTDTTSTSLTKSSSDLVGQLEDPEINPINMMLILEQEWGQEGWVGWEPETMLEMCRRSGFELPAINRDKFMALKIFLNPDAHDQNVFWRRARAHSKIVCAFNHRHVDWGQIQSPRVHEICAAVALVHEHIREQEFSPEVRSYVAAAAIRDGYVMLPPRLTFAAQEFTDKLLDTQGDEALEHQEQLMQVMKSQGSPEELAEGLSRQDTIQFVRLLRCQYHAEAVLDEVQDEENT